MTSNRRHQIDAWLQAALDLDDEAVRLRLLDQGCPTDLRADVDRLLLACAGPDALPPVSRMRIEALYDMSRERPVEEREDVEAGPRSPWSLGGTS